MDAKPRRIWLKVSVSVAVYALVAAAVLWMARVNPIVREGNSAEFWYAACRIDVDGQPSPHRAVFRAYPARDGWLVYEPVPICGGGPLYRVREEEAFADFPEVARLLAKMDDQTEWRTEGLARWRAKDPDAADPRLLLGELRDAKLTYWKRRDQSVYRYVLALEKDVDERWWLAQNWRPVQVAAELAYFAALASFLLWPWWRSARWPWYAAHLAWLPWLLLAPYWLGYSAAITPEGGVLYPIVRLYVPALESVEPQADLWKSLPRPLASLPGQVGAAGLAWFTIRPGQGPIAALAWSVILAGPVLLIGFGLRASRRRQLALERRDVRASSYSWRSLLRGDE
jgi:hypothetical protein